MIMNRKENPSANSYTCQLFERGRIHIEEKLREELEELIEAEGKENIVWEAADLLYHLMVYLAARGILLADVKKELERRRHAR